MFNPYNNRFYPQSNLDWIMVQNIEQVESIAVQPNHKAWIMVQNEPIFALRTSDAMGLISTEFYRFEKWEKPNANYITADDLAKALERLKGDLNESIIKANEQPKSTDDKTINGDVKSGSESISSASDGIPE